MGLQAVRAPIRILFMSVYVYISYLFVNAFLISRLVVSIIAMIGFSPVLRMSPVRGCVCLYGYRPDPHATPAASLFRCVLVTSFRNIILLIVGSQIRTEPFDGKTTVKK